jgi:hypothetical protein
MRLSYLQNISRLSGLEDSSYENRNYMTSKHNHEPYQIQIQTNAVRRIKHSSDNRRRSEVGLSTVILLKIFIRID